MKRTFVFLVSVVVSAYSVQANLLSNPGFENPPATTDFTGSDWTAGGSVAPNRAYWAARSGNVTTNMGGYLSGWNADSDGSVYQDVPVTTGTYTFSIWARNEPGYTALTNEVRIGWYDADTNLLHESTSLFANLPSDDLWHHLFVTGSSDSQNVALARVTYYAAWGTGGGGDQASFFDDADFYAGPHAGTPLENGSFERATSDVDNYWRASKWQDRPEGGAYAFETWAKRSGDWGLGVRGWETIPDPTNHLTVIQNLVPGTGTYSFTVYLFRENDFLLTNAQLRIEWFDRTFTNKVCADSVTNVVVPNDFSWNEYVVSGNCTSNDFYEARVSMDIDWLRNTNTGGGRALQVDDARFLPGLYDGTSLTEAWSYHGDGSQSPSEEMVPGTNVGAFLQVDLATQTSTFYAVTPHDGFATFAGEGGVMGLRTAWQRPENGLFVSVFSDMQYVGSLVIDAGSPFHGLPLAGAQTQDLWCSTMEFPRDTNGVYYTTNTITVFYSPYLRTTNEVGGETDRSYLVAKDATSTNNLGQLFHEAPEDKDSSFQLNPPTQPALADPGFETPAAGGFGGSPWTSFGGSSREVWGARAGDYGAVFQSFSPGFGGFFQDVDASNNTYTISFWVKRMLGANLNSMELKLEWFNQAAQFMYADTNQVALPADERWHRIFLTSTLPAGDPLFIRPVLFTDWAAGSMPFHEAVLIDDAELYPGPFTSQQALVNGNFETGDTNGGLFGAYWDGVLTDWVSRNPWAARNGAWGADFQGFVTGAPSYEGTLSQGLNLSTGTYVFAAWIRAEDSILLTNAEMRIEWLREDFTPAQTASLQSLNLPLDNQWYYYEMTGTCSAADLFEIRPLLLAQWDENLGGGSKAITIDDVVFGPPGAGDSDGDGIPNDWEQKWSGTTTGVQANADQDGDGLLGGSEYILDYDPINTSNEAFGVRNVGPGSFTLTFGVTTNSRVYTVDYVPHLTNAWSILESATAGSNGVVSVTDTNGAVQRSYRVRVQRP